MASRSRGSLDCDELKQCREQSKQLSELRFGVLCRHVNDAFKDGSADIVGGDLPHRTQFGIRKEADEEPNRARFGNLRARIL